MRFVFVFVFITILVGFVFDLSYLVHGVRCTYLRGEGSAQIDDYSFFYTRPINANQPVIVPKSIKYKNIIVNDSLNNNLVKYKSTAFLVIQNDSVVLEKYWGDGGPDVLSNSFSMAKSIMSLLVGSAIDGGFIESVEQNVVDFIPEIKNFDNKDPVKIKHLLGMSSGLNWLENYKRPISITAKAYYGKNINDLMFKQKFVSSPGEFFKYQSGDTQLLGVLLERAVGESVSDYASRALWSKIGASKNALWTLDSREGVEKTFCCFNGTARDFAKIGVLMLNGGKLNESVVVSPEYFRWLFSVPLLKMGNEKSSRFGKMVKHYSNSWYIARVLNFDVFYARGFLGQYIVVIPDLDLVFVRLGEAEDAGSYNNDFLLTNSLSFYIEQVILDFKH